MVKNWRRVLSRARLVAALAVAMTLFASAPAMARAHGGAKKPPKPPQVPRDWGTIPLENVGDEPSASGEATLTNVHSVNGGPKLPPIYPGEILYRGRLTVTCRNMAPGARYWTPAGTFTADAEGGGKVSGDVVIHGYMDPWWGLRVGFLVNVERVNPAGPTVLTGGWYFGSWGP